MKLRILAVAALGLGLSSAHAATSITTTFNVKIAITSTCAFATGAATDLNFGTTGLLNAPLAAQSAINIQCTATTPFNIGLDGGSTAASVTARQMAGPGGAKIAYALYQDSAHTTNWGNTIGTDTLAANGTGAAVAYPVYGLVNPQTTPAPGAYNDVVTVTVTY